ncbi:ankyrin repeat-containing protein bda1, partial [Quercus suber]
EVKLLEHIDVLPFVETPLHIAGSTGHIPFAWKLNQDGFSPIHLVLQNRHIELFDGDLARVKGRERHTPLHYVVATSDHHLDLLEEFLLVCPNSIADVTVQNETALHIALKYDKLKTFMFFVGWLGRNLSKNAEFYERGVLNWEDDHGNTVLHVVAVSHLLAWGSEFVSINRTNLEDCLRPPSIGYFEFWGKCHVRQMTALSDERWNVLLVVAALLVTISYQVVLNPPWGLWQDDRKYNATEIGNTTNSGTNDQTQCNTTVAHTVGTPIASKEYGFFLFMVFSVCNFLIFEMSNLMVVLLLLVQYNRGPVFMVILSLGFCFCMSFLTINQAPVLAISLFVLWLVYTILVMVGLMMQQLLQLRDEVLLHAAVLYVVFSFVLDFKIEHPQGPRSPFNYLVILENPVIYVFLPSHNFDFEVVKEANPVTHKKKFYPSPMWKGYRTKNRVETGKCSHFGSTEEPGVSEIREFDFDQGLIDAYSDLIAENNPDDFLDLEGVLTDEVIAEERRNFSEVQGVFSAEELEGEILE